MQATYRSLVYVRAAGAAVVVVIVMLLAIGAPVFAASDANADIGGSGFSAYRIHEGRLEIVRGDAVSARRLVDRGYHVAPVRSFRIFDHNDDTVPVVVPELDAVDPNGPIVAVLDTGIDQSHPWFQGRIVAAAAAYTSQRLEDYNGHGTHVAGVVVQAYPAVRLLPIRVLDWLGRGDDVDIAQGVVWAVDHQASVINLSLGSTESSAVLAQAIEYAREHGVAVVAAAGNSGKYGSPVQYPAAFDGVTAVTAIGADGSVAAFSNRGSYVDLSAPGDAIVSSYPGGRFRAMSGTSMAAPYVAGVLARMLDTHVGFDAAAMVGHLQDTSTDLGVEGWDEIYGWGVVDVEKAATTPVVVDVAATTDREVFAASPGFHVQPVLGGVRVTPHAPVGSYSVYVDGVLAGGGNGMRSRRVALFGDGLVLVKATSTDGLQMQSWWQRVRGGAVPRPLVRVAQVDTTRVQVSVTLPRVEGSLRVYLIGRNSTRSIDIARTATTQQIVRFVSARTRDGRPLWAVAVCLRIGDVGRSKSRCSNITVLPQAPAWVHEEYGE